MRPALFWVIKQQVVVISYRHLRTTYQSHLHELIGCPKTLVKKLPLLMLNNPEEHSYLTGVRDTDSIHSAQVTNLL
jgi:hypothetical protein